MVSLFHPGKATQRPSCVCVFYLLEHVDHFVLVLLQSLHSLWILKKKKYHVSFGKIHCEINKYHGFMYRDSYVLGFVHTAF